jgi:hypothetical protein
MRSDRTLATLAVVLLVGVAVAPPVLGSAPAGAGFLQTSVDPDAVVLRADVGESGTAEWTVEYRLRLADENATEAFESVRSDIEANASAFRTRFADGMSRTVAGAENVTGREMGLLDVTVSADRQTFGQEYGVIAYRFTWTNFATTDDDRLRVGDALSELFLDSETALRVAYPDGYGVETVSPPPTENRTDAVVWRGPVDFGADEPRLVVARGADDSGGSPVTLRFVAGAVVLALAVGGGAWLYRGRNASDVPPPPASESDDDTGVGADADAEVGVDDAGGAVTAPADDGEDEEPPAELLSNEERVVRLLDESGGRVKQQRIAEAFDWTDAKTSQVVGNLRDDDAVETFRIGRENVVTLPEESDLIDDGDDGE